MVYQDFVTMNQLTFKFPFSKKYYEQDFFVSTNNFSAFKLIDDWPNWPGKWFNIFGEVGSGKTHLSKILEKKITRTKLTNAKNVDQKTLEELNNFDCLIIDNFENNVDENLFYSILNQSKQLDNDILINSKNSIKNIKFKLKDLISRISSVGTRISSINPSICFDFISSSTVSFTRFSEPE